MLHPAWRIELRLSGPPRTLTPILGALSNITHAGAATERLTRLFGAGAPFRPLLESRSVLLCSGTENLPLQLQGKLSPDKTVSIGTETRYVK